MRLTDSKESSDSSPNKGMYVSTSGSHKYDGTGSLTKSVKEQLANYQISISKIAHVGHNVAIGGFTKIGNNCQIGRNATIGHDVNMAALAVVSTGTVIGNHVRVGKGSGIYSYDVNTGNEATTIIKSFIDIGEHSVIKEDCTIREHTFIGNNVMVGSGCSIGNNVRLGNLVLVGRNVTIPENITVKSGTMLPDNCSLKITNTLISDSNLSKYEYIRNWSSLVRRLKHYLFA